MRHLRSIASLAIVLLAALPIQAQTENQAFYIYQNDGHFDGFFYDEIEKMTFSFLDTLGVEHDEIVSQEIVTADSTYRIMLSAIDSIGFVQPETKYGPHVHIKPQGLDWDNPDFIYFQELEYYDYDDEQIVVFLPVNSEPQVGDVLVDFDEEGGGENGWSAKIDRLTYDYPGWEGLLVGVCKPIDDISDILQQHVGIEEYGYADDGTMVRRRVAGHPELNIGRFSKRALGQWEGDLFNFSISGSIPLYDDGENLSVNLLAAIDGKLHIKTTWNLSLFGEKYISIDTKLDFGVAGGFNIDGYIKGAYDGGVGDLAALPVPATCPLFCIKLAPEPFLRGEGHITFSAMTPKAKGGFWSKLEIKNWIPSFDMGFSSSGSEDDVQDSGNRASAKLGMSGFVQAGLQFPLTFENLPTLRRFLAFSTGNKMYLGPKIGGEFSIDLIDATEFIHVESTNPYVDYVKILRSQYKEFLNTKVQIHLLDADFEVKSSLKTAFTEGKEFTLASGSVSLFPPLDMSLVPDFKPCKELSEKKLVDGEIRNCRVLAFEPEGAILKPVTISADIISRINDDGTEDYNYFANSTPAFPDLVLNYYPIPQLFGQELSPDKWARLIIPYREGRHFSRLNGKFKVSPIVDSSYGQVVGSQEYIFEHGAIMHVMGDTIDAFTDLLTLNADGSTAKAITITSNCDSLSCYETGGYTYTRVIPFPEGVQVLGGNGNFSIEGVPGKIRQNYNPCDTLSRGYYYYGGVKTIEGEIFDTFASDPRQFNIRMLPNTRNPTTWNVSFHKRDFGELPVSVEKLARGWHCSVNNSSIEFSDGKGSLSSEFDVLYGEDTPESPSIRITKLNYTFVKPDEQDSEAIHTIYYTLSSPCESSGTPDVDGLIVNARNANFDIIDVKTKGNKSERKKSSESYWIYSTLNF